MKTENEIKKELKEIGIENLSYLDDDQYNYGTKLLNICDVSASKEKEIRQKVESLGYKLKYLGNFRLYFSI
jgi:hypothetical protein